MRIFALALMLAAVPLLAQQAAPAAPQQPAPPIPRYEVKKAATPVVVDGKLDDAAWSSASPAVTLQFLWENQTGAKQMTRARMVWDAQAFYVGFDADDTDITTGFDNRDDPVYSQDAVEIFINPNPQQETMYYGFEMSPTGVFYDYLNYNSRTLFKRWDATNMKIATSLRGTLNDSTDMDEGWSLEAAIPWQNFEELSRRPPQAGTVWKANLNRWDGTGRVRRMSIWSDPMNAENWPHVPSRFGELVFVD